MYVVLGKECPNACNLKTLKTLNTDVLLLINPSILKGGVHAQWLNTSALDSDRTEFNS